MKRYPVISFRKLLLDDSFDLRHKLLNMLITVSILGSVVSTFISIFIGSGTAGIIVNLMTIMALCLTFYISVIRRNKKVASYFVTIAMGVVFFPLMFIFNGGVYSGVPLWLTFGLIYPWMILEGKSSYIMFCVNLAAALGCFALQIFCPDMIYMPETKALTTFVVIDMAQVMILVPLLCGAAIEYYTYEYRRQRIKTEIQEKKLFEAKKAAELANEAKTSYLASMSHEIRTPINAVLGMDEMILRESRDENILSYAENIQSAGQSLLSVINDVLDLSKIESGHLELVLAEYGVQQLMNDCWNMVIMRAEKKNLLLEIKNSPDLPSRLMGDEVRIRQIIINLLTNGIKYTSAGSVTMTLSYNYIGEKEIMLRISVRDTGMGISPENQKNLFDSFRRLDLVTNRNIEGTGLGLSITKQLTQKMNGTISVSSVLGSGSEFIVEIPQKVVSEAPVGSFSENRRLSAAAKRSYHERFQAPDARILVVDDVKLNADVLKGLLKKTRIQIDTAYSGRECLGLVKKNAYDIIFMDHLMPEMDGIETLRNMRKIPDCPNADTPVIALTANALVGAREKYESCGFADYLSKPIQGDKLELMILKYLPDRLIRTDIAETAAPEGSTDIAVNLPELDPEEGLHYCGGDRELYTRLLGMLETDRKIRQLEEAYRDADWKSYERICGSVKSAALTVGAMRLADAASRMEKSAHSGRLADVRNSHSELIACCRGLNTAAAGYIRSNNISEGEKY